MELFLKGNRRGLVYLLPLLAIVALLAALAEPKDKVSTESKAAESISADSISTAPETAKAKPIRAFRFDPNTATFEDFVALGLSKTTAAGIIKYRKRGKVFSIPEEFAACYGVSDSAYQALKPYIAIAAKFEVKPFEQHTNREQRDTLIRYEQFRLDTVTVAYLQTIGFSHRRATAFLRYRDMRGGLRNIEEVRECYVIPAAECDTLARYIIFPEPKATASPDRKIELNTADSAMLRSVYGIGEKSVVEIMEYRRKLGGFARVEQLAEVKSVTESNFEKILHKISCDSFVISKIDINFASPKELERHPYVSAQTLRRIIKQRQLKGGWSRIEEMTEQNILSEGEAKRLAPYLRFRPRATE